MPTFYSAVKGTLPRFLERIADVSDSDADADMLILGSLAVISACLPNISGIYAKRHIFPNMYLFVTARAGTGKGRLYLCKSIVEPIHDELRAQAEIEEEKYRQDKEIYKRQKRGEGIPEPTPPPIRLLFLPANSSSTAIYQALNENGEQGLMFETEGDTLASTFGQDFGDFSDGLRKAFHHESISYLRRTQREYVNIKKPRLSTVLSGTPQQVVNLMSSVENGLFSRFLFYYLVCGVGAGLCNLLVPGWFLTVGASGAVYGILLAFGMMFPNERIYLYFLMPIKAKWFVIGYAAIELLEGLFRADGVAHFAHLGGMLFGLLLILYWRKHPFSRF